MVAYKFLDPQNDVAFKRIFGSEKNKDILIHFINDIMEFKDGDIVTEVTFLTPMQDPDIISKKQSIVDVLCKTQDGSQIILEMQVSPSKGFEKRAQYYASKAYSRQLDKGKGQKGIYKNLKQVIFIAISNSTIFLNKKDYISRHVILDQKTYEHDLKDFSFTFVELTKFPIKKISELKTIVQKWCYFFKYAEKTSEVDVKRIIGSDLVIERAYEALNQFNWTEQELLAYEQEIKRVLDNQAAEDYVRDEGIAIGIEKGIEKGKAEGLAEGEARSVEKGILTAIQRLKAKGMNNQEIADMLDLSINEIERLLLK